MISLISTTIKSKWVSIILVLCVVVCSGAFSMFFIEATLLLRSQRSSVNIINKISDNLDEIRIVLARAAIASDDAISAMESVRDTAVEEKLQSKKAGTEILKTLAKANDLVGHADIALVGRHGNDGLVADLHESVQASVTLQNSVTKNLDDTFLLARPTLVQLGDTSNEIAKSVPPILTNLTETSSNTAQITKDGAATIADVRKAVNYEVTELMKPVKKVKVVLDVTLHFIGKFLGY